MKRPLPGILLYLFAAALLGPCRSTAQRRIGVAYYDLDRLYDTLPSPFYDDTDHTPEGALRWDTERYRCKIRRTAAVLDSMRMPLAALCGVENEAVVRDLTAACRDDYCYVHRTLNSLTGMDFALLYYGDLFFPDRIESGRNHLYVEGELHLPAAHRTAETDTPPGRRERVGLLLTDDTRMAAWIVRDLRAERPDVRLLVLGRSASVPCGRSGLRNPFARIERAGQGNVRYRSGWRLRDRILADTALHASEGAVYARRFLFDARRVRPLPTYDRGVYEGGYSRALPVFVYLE